MLESIDIIQTWPNNIDYPEHRLWLNRMGGIFNKVIIYINEQNIEGWDFTKFVKDNVEAIFPKEVPVDGRDWRDVATHECLKHSDAEWIWFIEQDFLMDVEFTDKIELAMKSFDTIGFIDHNRLHPACWLVKRSLLEKTCKDFGAHPDVGFDHFAEVTIEARSLGRWTTFGELGLLEDKDWYHHAGLTSNYMLAQQGKKPNYNPKEFLVYNANSRDIPLPKDPKYISLTHKVEDLLTDIKKFL